MFDTLIKVNSGYFHNPKQACFMLGECEIDQYGHYVFTSTSNKKFIEIQTKWFCDSQGVLFVEKIRPHSQTKRLIWEREIPGRTPIQIQRAINKTTRKLNEAKKNISVIQDLWNNGTYKRCYLDVHYLDFYKEDLMKATEIEANLSIKLAKLTKQEKDNSNV